MKKCFKVVWVSLREQTEMKHSDFFIAAVFSTVFLSMCALEQNTLPALCSLLYSPFNQYLHFASVICKLPFFSRQINYACSFTLDKTVYFY